MRIKATIYEIKNSDKFHSYKDLWAEIISDINFSNKSCNYIVPTRRRLFTFDLYSVNKANEKSSLCHYLGVQSEFYRSSDGGLYIAISGANLFTDNDYFSPLTNDEINIKYQFLNKWVKANSQLNLQKHLFIVEKIYQSMKYSGWEIIQLPSQDITDTEFQFRNKSGVYKETFPKTKLLLRNPLASPDAWELRIICNTNFYGLWRESLIRAMHSLFPNGGIKLKNIQHGSYSDLDAQKRIIGILVLSQNDNFNSFELQGIVQDMEAKGALFKVARLETYLNCFAVENIVYDLFLLAGGVPWKIDDINADDFQFIGLDAGHDVKNQFSRWVSVCVDPDSNQVTALWKDTKLGEHLTFDNLEQLLSIRNGSKSSIIFRDGRFLSERTNIHGFFTSNKDQAIEVSKYPKAILYRSVGNKAISAEFGDKYLLPHKGELVQTLKNNSQYSFPLKLNCISGRTIKDSVMNDFLGLCMTPQLGLSNRSRLPAPVYWADLISKLDAQKWAKSIGRGFYLKKKQQQ